MAREDERLRAVVRYGEARTALRNARTTHERAEALVQVDHAARVVRAEQTMEATRREFAAGCEPAPSYPELPPERAPFGW